ncbi:MAG: glycosyltransferase family 2 protein [Chthoniobacteraceae bacterium]|nr:glycosyltransferase family 2 protein [Chthoniobacteraceae bacterium]
MTAPSEASRPLKIAALIPAYREGRRIGEVVRRVRAQLDVVLVVDDGSPDATADLAREAGAEVIVHAQNAGKGAAIKTGFRVLLERGFDYVLILDGDGQHLPEEISRFLEAANREPCGMFVGNRMSAAKGMPLLRWGTNRFMSWMISRLCGQWVPDTQCGFRMIHRDVIPRLFCESNAYDYETEMLLIAAAGGCRIGSVPVTTVYADETSKIHPLRDGMRFLKLLSRYRSPVRR